MWVTVCAWVFHMCVYVCVCVCVSVFLSIYLSNIKFIQYISFSVNIFRDNFIFHL